MKTLFFLVFMMHSLLVKAGTLPVERVNLGLSLSSPVAVRHAGDGSGRLFIAEQAGVIKIYNGASLEATNFLDISSQVFNSGERGLLGLDFDPNYTTNGHFYVYYSRATSDNSIDHDTIIERYTVSNNANIADINSGVLIMRIEQPAPNHNGGDMHFGPDGYLYIGMGDGGGSGDNAGDGNNAQNKSNLLGAMLRIDVSSTEPVYADSFENLAPNCGLDSISGSYKVPHDNPFINDVNSCAEIWAYGLRNPYRWSFDKLTGDMIIGDVGQGAYEEVNFQSSSSNGGENYGWRCREGAHDFNTSLCTGSEIFTEPVIDIPRHASAPAVNCSVMGGYVYRGTAMPALQGRYIFSDYCNGEINFTQSAVGDWSIDILEDFGSGSGTRGFGEDEAGEIYHIYGNNIFKFMPVAILK